MEIILQLIQTIMYFVGAGAISASVGETHERSNTAGHGRGHCVEIVTLVLVLSVRQLQYLFNIQTEL